MQSREQLILEWRHVILKDEETSKGVSSTVIAIDGIAVIVNKDNKVDGLTSEQVKTIFTGKTTSLGRSFRLRGHE